MTFKEAAKRIREHRQIHQKKEPCAILISEALEMAANFFDGYEAMIAEAKERMGDYQKIVDNTERCNFGMRAVRNGEAINQLMRTEKCDGVIRGYQEAFGILNKFMNECMVPEFSCTTILSDDVVKMLRGDDNEFI